MRGNITLFCNSSQLLTSKTIVTNKLCSYSNFFNLFIFLIHVVVDCSQLKSRSDFISCMSCHVIISMQCSRNAFSFSKLTSLLR